MLQANQGTAASNSVSFEEFITLMQQVENKILGGDGTSHPDQEGSPGKRAGDLSLMQ